MSQAALFDRHRVKVSVRFLALTLISCILVAYAVGKTARLLLIVNPQLALLNEVLNLSGHAASSLTNELRLLKLPTPVLPAGKVLPQTTYTSKAFDTARSSINSRWVVTEAGKQQCVDIPDHECSAGTKPEKVQEVESSVDVASGDDELHMPQGQHLLIDIDNVDAAFLNSEERLASAMLEMVNQCGLTLLSYHCHGLTPSGVSCAGVLLESHVSFHTWPAEGVITLDLFTCGDESLLPIVPLAEKLFSIPRAGSKEKPKMVWYVAKKLTGSY
jgi:S-adenosylmethionine decarboxylase proenzyme